MNQNNSLDNLLQQGHLFLERGQYEAGLEVFRQADSLFPNNAQVKYGLGLACFRLEQYQQSIKYLNLALRLQPIYPLALVRRGMAYKQLQHTELANADFEAVLQVEPITNEDWRARGLAFDELKRSEDALKCYEKALEIEPNDHQAWHNKGLTLQDLQRYQEALSCYTEALLIIPEKQFTWQRCGCSWFLLGKYSDALKSYSKALKLKSDDYYSLNGQGLSLASLGQFDEAIASYDLALQIKPDNFDNFATWYCRGNALSSLKKYEEALSCYEKALEINPDFQQARQQKDKLLSKIHNQRSQAYLYFILKILQTIADGGSQEQVCLLLQQNLHLLDKNLAQALHKYADNSLSNLEPKQRQVIGSCISILCTLIRQFPLGNQSNNIEIAITG